jgi:anthranilate phosphoribosyltransferase
MKNILNRLQEFDQLSTSESYDIIQKMSRNEFNNSEIAAFIHAYNFREISVDELLGFRAAMLSLALPFETNQPTIDLCGTGGDQKDTFNISTISSFIVAGSGIKVTKHGNYGVSSFCGSSNILESFGLKFTSDTTILNRQLEKANICFLHAPIFHPAMKFVAPIRKELGIKTFFNLLGPLVNPANPSNQLIGVFSPKVQKLYQFAHQKINKNVSIVHSLDGYDEISLTSPFKIIQNNKEQLLHSETLKMSQNSPLDLSGGNDIEEAKEIFHNILSGKGTTQQTNTVLANAGVAIANFKDLSFLEGITLAQESLNSGSALKSFQTLINQQN